MPFYTDDSRDEYILGDVRIFRSHGEPCPVCGQEGGNCTGELAPPERILLHGTTPSLENEQTVYVEEDIYAERTIGGLTTVRFLVARKGTSVTFEKARELGII